MKEPLKEPFNLKAPLKGPLNDTVCPLKSKGAEHELLDQSQAARWGARAFGFGVGAPLKGSRRIPLRGSLKGSIYLYIYIIFIYIDREI